MGKGSRYGIPAAIAATAVCLVCVCVGGLGLFYYGGGLSGVTGISGPSGPSSLVPADTSNLPEWTVMLYEDADDKILEEDMMADVNEMELTGSTPQVNIVVQLDRAEGAYSGDGDWTGTRRYLIQQDSDMNHIASPVVQDIGEADMGNPQTLVDFMSWAIKNYPAKRYALIMSDHGGGWTGGFSDEASGSSLTLPQITNAIDTVQKAMGGQKFEVIGFDACLMSMIEVYGSLYPYSNYMVASEEVIPSTGWSYAAWLSQLTQNPTEDGRAVSQAIVQSYIVDDTVLKQRASQADIQDIEAGATLSAIESDKIPDVINSMNQFIDALANVDQSWVAQGREYAQGYYSIFGEDVPSSFIDLGNFAKVMQTTNDSGLQQTGDALQTAISNAVVTEKHGDREAGSTGISFHFPISDIYSLTELTDKTGVRYATDAAAFLQQSSWDEFLAYHYLGQAYVPQEGTAFVPNRALPVVAPGASPLTIAPVQLSSKDITGDQKLTLTTTVTGNVSYIYFILYYYNPDQKAYWVADTSYVFAPNSVTTGGVNRPDYGPSPIQVSYDWSPGLFMLTDGTTQAFALFEPDEYVNAEGVSTYSAYGRYTYANGSGSDNAKIMFDPDGNLLHIYALQDANGDGITTPFQITPQTGDTFTDYVKSYYFDQSGAATYDYSLSNNVFTYGSAGFKFEARFPVDGQYAVGFYAVDFDNNTTSSYDYVNYHGQ